MLDPIIEFFERGFRAIGRGFGMLVAWIVWPFMALTGWYRRRHWLVKGPIGLFLIVLVALYGYFIWQTQVWSGFNPELVKSYDFGSRTLSAGEAVPDKPGTCEPSAVVKVASDLTDFNVNQNAWISSMVLYKAGLFGMDWDNTPFLDNKASFQRGVNQVVRRTAIELVDALGRVRGTSSINNDLQRARGNIQFDEYTWYFGLHPFGFKTPTPSFYRQAIKDFDKFNTDLASCNATFDTRADNLIQLFDRMASDLGSTSDILRKRSEDYNSGWFDTRADDRFWFAYGQLYAQYAVLSAARSDFADVVKERNLGAIWSQMDAQFEGALKIRPAIISNGSEAGWIMPTHLATMGFYILRVRSNLVELRSVLDR
jgi:hypothetical protein